MATITKYIDDFFEEHADKRVSNWLFMSSIWPTLYIVLIYLSLVYVLLPAYMKNRKPYDLIFIIRVYNILQIAICGWLIYWTATSGWIQGDYSLTCQPVDYSYNPQAMYLLQAFHWSYFLKLTELIETILFILRKKFNQVTKLHVYHHASTATLAWIGCKFTGGGMVSIPMMVNSFIHILMYTYYFLASLGPKWQKKIAPWKSRLTIAQMAQFTLLIIQALVSLRPSCKGPVYITLIYLPNIVLIYKMFYNFYQTSYKKKTN